MWTLKAFAKLNLSLSVGPKGGDGFHPIRSIFQEILLYDVLDIHFDENGEGLVLTSTHPDVPTDSRNTLFLAYSFLKQLFPTLLKGQLKVQIHKHIPMGGGLGGGSSDAAAFLVGMNHMFQLGLSKVELEEIAAKVGSDVPFFILGGRQLAQGRGEKLEPLEGAGPFGAFLLIFPGFEVATPLAYRLFDDWPKQVQDESEVIRKGWGENHLQAPVFEAFPLLKEVEKIVTAQGFDLMMTGSGSTLFSPFRTRSDAQAALHQLSSVIPYPMQVVQPCAR